MPTFSTLFFVIYLRLWPVLPISCEDRLGGLGGVGGAGDGAAYDQHGGSVSDGLGGGGDALLISYGAAGRADSGDDEEGVRAGFSAEGRDLFGGADHAVDS